MAFVGYNLFSLFSPQSSVNNFKSALAIISQLNFANQQSMAILWSLEDNFLPHMVFIKTLTFCSCRTWSLLPYLHVGLLNTTVPVVVLTTIV